ICHPIRNDFVYDVSSLPEFQNLQVADKGLVCEKSLRVDLLIGADNFWKFVKNKTIRSSKGLVGTDTKLGYIFSGPLTTDTVCSTTQASVTLSAHTLNCQTCDVDSTLRKFWEIEEVGRTESPKEVVLQEFESKIKFEQARYEVQLPFIEKHEILKDNLYNSTRRMNSLLTKFKTNEQLLHDYDAIIKDQLQQGIIEVAPDTSIEGQTYYMPHRPVLRLDRLTTKIRMVFDASSSLDGPALNDCLHAGPSLTSSLFGTLLRFRAKKIGIIADLEKAFLQIRLNEKDRDYVRFLWIKNINDINFDNFYNNDLLTYRFCRVLFGVTSSPFLLNATLRHHVNKHENELFRNTVLNSLHVDDLSTSFDSMQEAFDFYKNCKSHFALASLNLRKLQSNCANLEAKVKNCYMGDLETIDHNLTKVLGIPWDKTNDSLVISLSEILRKVNFENPTKRNVIQFASSIFDPLGLINPLVVKFKLLFQKLCTQNLQWDEPIPDDSLKIWKELITD
uniref:Peptidase aspartic putative domain-containing protein n=1 Tax=Clytia hemisphaerica TaxID=252671 RepID=A0A7M5XLH7_9CNID